jgi:short-subunit dehydrogenase
MNKPKLYATVLTGAGTLIGAAIGARLLKRYPPDWISGKVVLITGGSRGLGLCLAREFGNAGARLALIARDREELERAKQLLVSSGTIRSENVLLIEADLTRPADIAHFVHRALDYFGRIDILINNASLIHVGPIEQQPIQVYREAMETGYFAMIETIQAVLPQMLDRGNGAIVNIASIGGKVPVPHLAPYTGMKFAAVGFSETLNAELRPKGIRVTTVCPGLMRTGSFPNAIVTGDLKKEYRWFAIASTTPGLSHSAEAAARKIFRAVRGGRAEITIGPDAWFAARFAAVAPETTQRLAGTAGALLLPKPDAASTPTEARHIPPPQSRIFRALANRATEQHNQPRP